MGDLIVKLVAALFIIVFVLAFWQVVRDKRRAKSVDEGVNLYQPTKGGRPLGKEVDLDKQDWERTTKNQKL